MHRRILVLIVAVVLMHSSTQAFGQEANVELLKQRVEYLELKLQLAEQEAERLAKECEELRKENAKLKGETTDGTVDENDPFKSGVVWVGEGRGSDEAPFRWALSVSDRKGGAFEGAIAIITKEGKKIELPVAGKAPTRGNGVVEFESALVGRAKMFMRGTLRNGAIALAFSGTTPLGRKVFGSATLAPKN
ncbi:hypothetical protein LOC68_05260 [Blastopirellula sp. JC732]|uniref:Uncharacterized protein n=1 Tax=Blastopirellula sediminis TaxID=2894196 RepID=A0A9X1MKB0_9BACT|nr:hypothetical protein [Blastopirellula sediminis]MCC9609428.1 hypothetical protein [Blastopirellula sediminis]MCC9627795.1 hypothetical protein [Blastopirellula sediminis]